MSSYQYVEGFLDKRHYYDGTWDFFYSENRSICCQKTAYMLDAIVNNANEDNLNEEAVNGLLNQGRDKLKELNEAISGNYLKKYTCPTDKVPVAVLVACANELSAAIEQLENKMIEKGLRVFKEKKVKRIKVDLEGKSPEDVLAHYLVKVEVIDDQIDTLYETKMALEEKIDYLKSQIKAK